MTPQPFTAAAAPAIDCFYVYPTVSAEKTKFADLADSPEIQAQTRAQVGRLSSKCRVFAPIYRQTTTYGMSNPSAPTNGTPSNAPTLDVLAAWNYYLKYDNDGRGVVLIGHSQGTILLQALMASSIDGTKSQEVLVSAFLAGDPSLGVPVGAKVGGTFRHIPVCSKASETGCVYVWGSVIAGDNAAPVFGRARTDDLVSACVSPAAPSGGTGTLKYYHSNTQAPWWIEAMNQFTGKCQTNSEGANTFAVSVTAGKLATANTALLKSKNLGGGWGIHPQDLNLVQGNILDVLDAEIVTWKATH